ncbi:hypothetical protein [Aneurinibacillus migulanus]|uniref:Uncharacterized protein n=1 Tax=Aneurinibacillus migulanus TaxID=47500 RepID=A0A1G8IQ86_ANEMI|nr:hypothetical protein [Aneurinibacillus migulanus]MCP1356891.1 hypothetical protein [Aneurinibacillus migulanus]MED0892374.1 hypothetical protein [Aneurinibacillus migulanus]MED1615673.1 hypothetical protein [Aneurinibacillus migulanus]MED4731144.1 hypothetical protein [Aneurinibacillus migulanus]SDI20971.1 hypothetical protein SAMN04487909_102124 [Aneurinibacillus migulanus]
MVKRRVRTSQRIITHRDLRNEIRRNRELIRENRDLLFEVLDLLGNENDFVARRAKRRK